MRIPCFWYTINPIMQIPCFWCTSNTIDVDVNDDTSLPICRTCLNNKQEWESKRSDIYTGVVATIPVIVDVPYIPATMEEVALAYKDWFLQRGIYDKMYRMSKCNDFEFCAELGVIARNYHRSDIVYEDALWDVAQMWCVYNYDTRDDPDKRSGLYNFFL